MKIALLILAFILANAAYSQYVNIPDTTFKNYLLSSENINTNKDNEISNEEAVSFHGIISISGMKIYDLTGIEAFINLRVLDCSGCKLRKINISSNSKLEEVHCKANFIDSLDLSNNFKMKRLYCDGNRMKYLNVSKCRELEVLYCKYNNFKELNVDNCVALLKIDFSYNPFLNINVKQNENLILLKCYNNKITELDLTFNTELEILNCYNNKINQLDISNNKKLIALDCSMNNIKEIDVRNNQKLQSLYIHTNPLSEIDLSENTDLDWLHLGATNLNILDVSLNRKLTKLIITESQIEKLDLTKNNSLKNIIVKDNKKLSYINLQNGNNSLLQNIEITKNPQLYSVKVDDAIYSKSKWGKKDFHTIYCTNCKELDKKTQFKESEDFVETISKEKKSKKLNGEKIYVITKKMPSFPGGEVALKKYLSRKSKKAKGSVYVRFVIDKNGNAKEPKIIKSLSTELDKKTIELITAMPVWLAGEKDGKKVNVWQTLKFIYY